MQITEAIAARVLEVVDAGLSSGMGVAKPGQMCVEAAVCFALGQPHGDEPSCVHPVVRRSKISLNDSSWSSNKARAKGLRRIAIAQLGSTEIDAVKFSTYVAEHTIRRIVPMALEAAAKLFNPDHAEKLLAASKRCADEGSSDAASDAASAASDAASAASDKILTACADIGVEALVICKADGVKFLGLAE